MATVRRTLMNSVMKIPLFKGLSPSQAFKLLELCAPGVYQKGETVCGVDAPSGEMYILISGSLAVMTSDGVQVATVHPVSTVGEMGLVMNQTRSATVCAIDTSHVFTIPKISFDGLLRRDTDMQVRIYRNIIEILSVKILKDNVRTRDYELEKSRRERLLREQRATAEVALNLLVKQGGMTRDEAESHVADQKRDAMLEILIVDDEPEIRRFAKGALPTSSVREAADGEEALAAIGKRRPDLVVTDIRMPQMDGYTLLVHLREQYPDLPVLAISGYVSAQDVDEHDFDGFITKPTTVEEFRQIVRDAVAEAKEAASE